MPTPDPPPPWTPSREEVIVIRRSDDGHWRLPECCLPTIIRKARYEELEELIAVIQWFGMPGSHAARGPEDYVRVPGLSLEEARALVRLRIKRRELYPSTSDHGAGNPAAGGLCDARGDGPRLRPQATPGALSHSQERQNVVR